MHITYHISHTTKPKPKPGARVPGAFWPRIYVVKKGHARDIYFLLQTRSFWHFSAPSFSLYVLLSTRQCLSSAVFCIGSSYIKLRSGRSADLRSLRWCSLGRLAGVGYMRIVYRVTRGKVVRFFAFAPEMEELVWRRFRLAPT
jgi:hypothetical protein